MSTHLLLIMTEKQERILNAALELFSSAGYTATSTSKVAKHAGVSEGLVFKHFKNKEGLVEAILALGEKKMKTLVSRIIFETDSTAVIHKTLDLPFNINEEDYHFWRLQMKLKWELGYNSAEKLEPVRLALVSAFTKLGVQSPDAEASLVLIYLDGMASALLKGSLKDTNSLRKLIKKKYTT